MTSFAARTQRPQSRQHPSLPATSRTVRHPVWTAALMSRSVTGSHRQIYMASLRQNEFAVTGDTQRIQLPAVADGDLIPPAENLGGIHSGRLRYGRLLRCRLGRGLRCILVRHSPIRIEMRMVRINSELARAVNRLCVPACEPVRRPRMFRSARGRSLLSFQARSGTGLAP